MSYRADIEVPLRQRIKELEDRLARLQDMHREEHLRAEQTEARAERLEKALDFIAKANEPCSKDDGYWCAHCFAKEALEGHDVTHPGPCCVRSLRGVDILGKHKESK